MAELIKTYMADHKVKFLMKHVPTKVYYIHTFTAFVNTLFDPVDKMVIFYGKMSGLSHKQ